MFVWPYSSIIHSFIHSKDIYWMPGLILAATDAIIRKTKIHLDSACHWGDQGWWGNEQANTCLSGGRRVMETQQPEGRGLKEPCWGGSIWSVTTKCSRQETASPKPWPWDHAFRVWRTEGDQWGWNSVSTRTSGRKRRAERKLRSQILSEGHIKHDFMFY